MAERPIIVTGSKGGVGTTTVALNVAVHMTQLTKKRVGLIEFARLFGQISLMLDFDPRFTLLDALERIDRLDLALLASLVTRHKTGVEILAGPLHALCAPTSVNWLRSKRCCASSNSPARPSTSSSLISTL